MLQRKAVYGVAACLLWLWPVGETLAQKCKIAKIPASTAAERFTDHGDGTITDSKTGLMWKKCIEGLNGSQCDNGEAKNYTWQQALQRAINLDQNGGFAGHTDWRVPNAKELKSLVEDQCYRPSINLTVFPANSTGLFWTSSPYIDNGQRAWSVYFNFGSLNRNPKGRTYRLRLVRNAD